MAYLKQYFPLWSHPAVKGVSAHWFNLVILLIRRDLKVRYRNSILGYLWSMLNPLFMMSILTIVFSQTMRFDAPHYPMYILSGILCWNMFNQSAMAGVHGIVNNSSLLKKVRVPSWVFPTSTIGSACVHMSLALVPYMIIAIATGVPFSFALLQLPLVVMVYFVFIVGCVLALSTLNVFFRDVSHVIEPVLQLVFFGTPIFYPISIIPDTYRKILLLNPIYYFLEGFRSALYNATFLSPLQWLVLFTLASLSFAIGVAIYRKAEHRFLYHI